MNIQVGSGIEEKVIKKQSKTNLIVNLAICRSWYNHGYITYLLPFLDLEKVIWSHLNISNRTRHFYSLMILTSCLASDMLMQR